MPFAYPTGRLLDCASLHKRAATAPPARTEGQGTGLDLRDRRELNRGFGDGLARAFELALTPAVFGGLGLLLDRATGTVPVFAIVFLLLAFVGMGIRMWYGYDHEMRRHEREATWRQGRHG